MSFDYNNMTVQEDVENFYEEDLNVQISNGMKTVYWIIIIAAVVWACTGIAALIMSIVCFGRSGSTGQHVAGILLAIFFGPFYWIYYFVVKSYCVKEPKLTSGGGRRFR